MLLFTLISQFLSVMTCVLLWWLMRPKHTATKIGLVAAVFIGNNLMLAYGLSEFWGERFRLYLITGILQGFLLYAVILTAGIYYASKHRTKNLGVLNKTKVLEKLITPLSQKSSRLLASTLFIGITSLAIFNAYVPKVNYLTVHTSKSLATPLRIALVSDTHLGKWFGNRQIDKLVKLIDDEQVDTVLIAGDIMDDDTRYYDSTHMHAHLAKLNAPLGVYAVLGNHDFMRQSAPIAQAVARAGITVLDNQSVLLKKREKEGGIWLVGRSDDVDRGRLSAQDLLKDINTEQPVIFLEHRPTGIDEVSQLPVDLHLSGHTHGGQIFPLTLLLDWLTPLNHGNKRIGNTDFVVSSGYGFGGVPFRLGTRSEVWVITLSSAF